MVAICLFGPDGSGKSTLARVLARFFSNRGIKVRVAWLRGTHTFASVLARFLRRFKVFQGDDNPYYGLSVPSNFRCLWQIIEFISIIPIWLCRFVLPRLLGYTIIGERSILDFIVWISLTTRDLNFPHKFLGRTVLALGLKNYFNVYVRADLNVLLNRRRTEPTLLPMPTQLVVYDVLAKTLKTPTIDTTDKSVGKSFQELLGTLVDLVGDKL